MVLMEKHHVLFALLDKITCEIFKIYLYYTLLKILKQLFSKLEANNFYHIKRRF